MPRTLTIQLPDSLEQQLSLFPDADSSPLEDIVLQTLHSVAQLMRSLQDHDPNVRIQAVKTLGTIGLASAIPALSQALEDKHGGVRQAAADALQTIGTESALIVLANKQFQTTQGSDAPSTVDDSLSALIGTLHLGTTDLAENHDGRLQLIYHHETVANSGCIDNRSSL